MVTPQTSAVLLWGRDGCRTYLHENRVKPVLSPATVPGEAVGGEVLRGYLLILTSGTLKPDQPSHGRPRQPAATSAAKPASQVTTRPASPPNFDDKDAKRPRQHKKGNRPPRLRRCTCLGDHPVSRFATATPPQRGIFCGRGAAPAWETTPSVASRLPPLRRGEFSVAAALHPSQDHPVSRFATATPPQRGIFGGSGAAPAWGTTPSVASRLPPLRRGEFSAAPALHPSLDHLVGSADTPPQRAI